MNKPRKPEEKCKFVYFDGAGHYCRLLLPPNKDYPHKHIRVMCFGEQGGWTCKAKISDYEAWLPDEEEIVLINPEMVRRKGERLVDEGCLSLPGYVGQVKRSELVTVKGLDRDGKKVRIKADELLSQVLEHEIDHLNGALYIDHLEGADKLRKIEPEENQL